MKSLYHTHAWVDITSAKHPDLAKQGILPLLSLSDTSSIDGQHSTQITLAGRAPTGELWSDLILPGDLISAGAQRVEEDGSVSSASLIVDSIVQDSQLSESLQAGSYSMTTNINASGLQSVMQQDSVAWWMFYGSDIGATRMRGELLPDALQGKLDQVFANYMSKAVFSYNNWKRNGTSLKERLGYYFHTLKPHVPTLINMTIAQGTHWSIIEQYMESSLHEMFVQMRAPKDGDRPLGAGFAHDPSFQSRAIISSASPGKHDGKRPYIVIRPKPFPYADKDGNPQLSEWNSLFMHDLGDVGSTIGQRGFTRSRAAVRNFTMVYPGYDLMNEKMSLTTHLAVWNEESVRRYGYSPAQFKTRLILNSSDQGRMLDLARALSWRVATQMNRMDSYLQGNITVPLSPKIQPGDRVRFRLILADGTPRGIYQGYVTSRTHSYSVGQGGTTSISLERVLPEKTYSDPKWFVEGLQNRKIE